MALFHANIDPVYLIKRLGTDESPFIPINQPLTVKYGRVILKEFPDFTEKVTVVNDGGLTFEEVTTAELGEQEYRVDYTTGAVFFHISQEGKKFNFSYLGTGYLNIPASRVSVDDSNTNGEIITIQDILDAQGNIVNRLTDTQVEIKSIEDLVTNNKVVKSIDYEANKTEVTQRLSQKAEQTYVDNALANITDGSPKELFYSVNALKSKYPSGSIGTMLVYDATHVDGAHSYFWNGTTWEDLGLYQGSKVAAASLSGDELNKNAIKPRKLFGTQVYNVFNKDTALINQRIVYTNGVASITNDNNWAVSDYEAVTAGETFTIEKATVAGTTLVVYFDSNKKPISDFKSPTSFAKTTYTVPTNAYFKRTNVIIDKGIDTAMIAVGSTYPTVYYPYQKAKVNWIDLDEVYAEINNTNKSLDSKAKELTENISNVNNALENNLVIEDILQGKTINRVGAPSDIAAQYYGFSNRIAKLGAPIKKIKMHQKFVVAGAMYKCELRSDDRTTLYGTASATTPLADGSIGLIEFVFDTPIDISEANFYVVVYSSTTGAFVSSSKDTTLRTAICTADSSKGNLYFPNPTNSGSGGWSVSPVNSYYMQLEFYSRENNILPLDKSIGIEKLTEDIQAQLSVIKNPLSLFLPKKIFTWGNAINGDYVGARVPRVSLYLDHAIPWGTDVSGMRFLNTSQKNRLDFYTPYPLDWTLTTINDGKAKQEISKAFTVVGDKIQDITASITQVSVRNDVGADKVVALFTIGDSTVEGANAFITLPDGTQVWAPFWHVVAQQFAMDSIEANDANKYRFVALGTRAGKGGPATVNHLGKTRNIITATGGESGSKLADHLRYVSQKRPSQATWDLLGLGNGTGTDYTGTAAQKDLIAQTAEVYTGTEADYRGNNPFFDQNKTGNNRFSIAKWLERYRTLDDNGNRLALGSGTGTKVTSSNINILNVCTPTHFLLQTGLNDWSQVSVAQYIADMDITVSEIKAQLPNAKIAITLFADDPGTYFKELYPDISDSDMRYLHDRTRPYITALFEHFANSTDVELLPFYFVMPPAVSLSYRWVRNDEGRLVKVPFGPASNDYHSNGYAHTAWGHQLYAWIKSTLV